jgi:hypothetical protein
MSSPQVLRVLKKDGSGHLLVYIEPEGRQNQLDLKLTGTDTDVLYATSIKDSSTKNLKTNNFSGNLSEWKSVLAFVLLHERPEGGPLPDHLKGVEIVAEIAAQRTFTLIIRKIVGAITQSLGHIELEYVEEEISVFDWVKAAAESSDELREQLQTLQKSSAEQQNHVARLTTELDQLVKAKKDHEQELLSKFAALLNEKKLKIRDQQRLLSHAKVDPDAAEDVRNARSKDPVSRKAGTSRSKRKANDEDENMTENEEETPAASDEETADEDDAEEEGGFAPAPAASQASSRKSQSQAEAAHTMSVDELPPTRALPFSKPRREEPTPPANSVNQKAIEEEDEETEDDEL